MRGHHVGFGQGTFELQVTVLDEAHRLGATHQRQHPGKRDRCLLVASDEQPEEEHGIGDEPEEVDEQRKLSDGELTGPHRAGGDHEDDPGTDIDRVPEQRLQHRLEHLVLDRDSSALVAQTTEVLDH